MELVPSDRKTGLQTPVWRSYQSILFEAGCVVRLQPPPRELSGTLCTSWEAGEEKKTGAPGPPYSCGSLAHPPQKSGPGDVTGPCAQPPTSQVTDPVVAWGPSPTPAYVSGTRGK